jgi:hypothetical protein
VKYRVKHTSRYKYGGAVDLAAHMLHLRPRPLPWQTIISEDISADPDESRRHDADETR